MSNDTLPVRNYDAKTHYARLYEITPREFAFDEKAAADFHAWQQRFRPALIKKLGLEQIEQASQGHQVVAERRSIEALEDFDRELWAIWVEPTVPLPFYLLRPKNQERPLPLVITPHGHSVPHMYAGIYLNDEEKQKMEEDRDIAVQAVREGYLAIAPTTRAFGETRAATEKQNDKTHSCRTQLMQDLLVGRTPIGERVWDMMKILDWVLENLSVDRRRTAITGNSGGGTISLFTAACDERFQVCMPGSYFCTFTGSIGTIRHCDCNYIPGILQLGEMYDIAGLIAPRPFCAIAGREDHIFPLSEVKTAMSQLRKIYEAAGVPGNCELHIGDGGHRYYRAGAWPFLRKCFDRI